MTILKQGNKNELVCYGSTSEDFQRKISITTDDGTLLRFDKYRKPGSIISSLPVTILYRQFLGDKPFHEHVLQIDQDDPRRALMVLPTVGYPLMFRSRKVHFECVGEDKLSGVLKVLFYGHILVQP